MSDKAFTVASIAHTFQFRFGNVALHTNASAIAFLYASVVARRCAYGEGLTARRGMLNCQTLLLHCCHCESKRRVVPA